MQKDDFLKALKAAGYSCNMKNGVPTVHATEKGVLKAVKKLAKELSYEQSFGVALDGGFTEEEIDTDSEKESGIEVLEDSVDEPAKDELTEKPAENPSEDMAEAAGESLEEDTESKAVPSSDSEADSIYNQPSLFDMFDDFD